MDQPSRTDIAGLLHIWIETLKTLDPDKVAALYAEDAILLPTLSKEIRQSQSAIRDYFKHFLAMKPRAEVLQQTIRSYGQAATNSGLYKFFAEIDGAEHIVVARFTFVYRQDNDGWKIVDHHSSMLPDT